MEIEDINPIHKKKVSSRRYEMRDEMVNLWIKE